MAEKLDRKFPDGSLRITTGCQYCAVGCGYNAYLVPENSLTGEQEFKGVSRFITPPMRGTVNYKGKTFHAAVAPDARCDLNKGNHSVRGGSQGHNLVSAPAATGGADLSNQSTKDRLTFPKVRLSDGCWHKITWDTLEEVMSRLIVHATGMQALEDEEKILVETPEHLGVKIYEYQYLENTYAATKLFYSAIGTPNVAYHDRSSAAGSSPGLKDVGMRPHDFSYEEVQQSDVLIFIGTNPYENQSVFFMQHAVGREMIVIDPRRTATAQYAERTGGLHVQPKNLGTDTLILFAICREILKRWVGEGNSLDSYPWRDSVMEEAVIEVLRDSLSQEKSGYTFNHVRNRRKASRVLGFDKFATTFLEISDANSTYTLDNASEKSGVPIRVLEDVVDRIFNHTTANRNEQPRVGVIYEKGMIWGFNYHNTASVGALGILVGAGRELGRFVGRVGGHQKGWAESLDNLSSIFASSSWRYEDSPEGCDCLDIDYSEGYPFRNVADFYSDSFLNELAPNEYFDKKIPVHHNLDNHVFGPPPEFLHPNQSGLNTGYVRLKNGLETKKDPDVKLLWIVGNNYLGQTNDAQRKRQALQARRAEGSAADHIACPAPPPPGQSLSADDIVPHFIKLMDQNGIVLVHQELFANSTTELCDIVIPAVGWGEEPYIRYNAQRRLRLYDRFQDGPLDKDEISFSDDPASSRDDFLYSPKPDWMIFRDIAQAIGKQLGPPFAENIRKAFSWANSSELADAMAEHSHRGKEGERQSGSKSMLGDMLDYGAVRGIAEGKRLHEILGASDGTNDAQSSHLGPPVDDQPKYVVYDPHSDNDHLADPSTTSVSDPVQSNGIASNGILLPVIYVGENTRELRGTWRVHRWKPDKKFCFIAAPWSEIEPFANEFAPGQDEVFVTNGRFNHLWNNMFHHLRNDYVNERYPEDLPGTILELNPQWADRQGLENGQVVSVNSGESSFRAIVSRQCSVPENGAFAMFSYPVRENGSGKYQFDGFVNNISNGYTDGINPIGALKYGKAKIVAVENPNGGSSWVFPRDFPGRVTRGGPTFEPRNQIIQETIDPDTCVIPAPEAKTDLERKRWKMRELVVAKGLPRVAIHPPYAAAGMLQPDTMLDLIRSSSADRFRLAMFWPKPSVNNVMWDRWREYEVSVFTDWIDAEESLNGPSPVDPSPGDNFPGGSNNNGGTSPMAVTFSRVKEILDNSINAWRTQHGRQPSLQGIHGNSFSWETLNELRDATAIGMRLIDPAMVGNGRGAETALVKALKDPNGFNGFGRMPARGPFIPDNEINEIIQWIDNGMPADSPSPGGPPPAVTQNRYERVVQILEESVGPGSSGPHGRFWLNQTRDDFVGLQVFGLPLIEVGNSSNSNLVKAITGIAPFDGTSFRQMPAGKPPISQVNVDFIRAWIDDGCPDNVSSPVTPGGQTGPTTISDQTHNDFWREFDNWALYQVDQATRDRIGRMMQTSSLWLQAAIDSTLLPQWEAAIQTAEFQTDLMDLAARQVDTAKTYYGNPIDEAALFDSFQKFGRDTLPDDPLRPQEIRHCMNGPVMWFIWASFAAASVQHSELAADWRLFSRAILLGLLNDGVYRGRFTVQGFSANQSDDSAILDFVTRLADDEIQNELLKRYRESGLSS